MNFSPFFQTFNQVAYITNDVNGAVTMFRNRYGIPDFKVSDSSVEAWMGADPIEAVQLAMRVAVVRLPGVAIELIEDIGSTTDFFRAGLPAADVCALKMHHVKFQIEGSFADWQRHMEKLQSRRELALFGQVGDGLHFAFTDERDTLGHYVEYGWFSSEIRLKMSETIPHFPID